MTYGPVSIPGSTYIRTTPNTDGIFGEVVRVQADPVQLRMFDELSEAFYGAWKKNVPYQYGDWNLVVGDAKATDDRFNQLQHLVSLMGLVGFHYANVAMGYPVGEDEYRYVDTTYRYRVVVGDVSAETEVDYTNDGAALGPITREDLLPGWIADMDRMEALLGESTRGIRDYYIELFLLQTGIDLTGVF